MDEGYVDRILFVTWTERLEDESLVTFLEEHGVEIFRAKESPVSGHGNIWHQMRALDLGLQNIPDNYRVLKTRSDVYIDKDFVRKALTGQIEEMHSEAGSGLFDEKIWVPFFAVDKPFYICDFCFYAKKTDMKKLYNYDMRYEASYDLGVNLTEKRRFISPYFDHFPFLKTYYSVFFDEGWGRNVLYNNRHRYLHERLQSKHFGALLAFYYNIMDKDYYVKYEPIQFRDGAHYDKYEPLGDKFMANFKRGPKNSEFNLLCKSSEWLDNQVSNVYNTDVPLAIRKHLSKDFSDWQEFTIHEGELKYEISNQSKHIAENYLDHDLIIWASDNILERFNLKPFVLKLYLNSPLSR